MKTNARPRPVEPPPPSADLLLDLQGLDHYRRAVADGVECVVHQWSTLDQPCSGISPEALGKLFQTLNLDTPLGNLAEAMDEAGTLYLRDAMYFHHPHYVAHLNCPVLVPALAAETILSAVNSSLDTWDQSVGASLIEQKIMSWTAIRCGLDPVLADGVMTSGGTQSNLMAMLLARDIAAERMGIATPARHQGLPDAFRHMRILAADTSHFSIHKAASLLGLGDQAVIDIATDDQGCLQAAAVERALVDCQANGWIPIVLVATAGTTDFGSIDPLPALLPICRRHGLRLHVDAAYGGGLLVSSQYRHRLNGIEGADSITLDYHKSWFQPVSCSAFLLRDRQEWRHLTYHADYLNPEIQTLSGRPNLVNKSLQTTRRFDAFKIWLSLRSVGPEAIGAMFDAVIDLAHEFHQWLLLQPDVQLASRQAPMLSTLLFRYRPPGLEDEDQIDAINQRIRDALLASGQGVIGGTRRRQRHYLKFTLLNPRTTLTDLQYLLQLIRRQASRIMAADDSMENGRPSA